MPAVSDEAVVLARYDYSETSQVVVFLTREHGKVRALAKGIKRGTRTRFAAGADLLDIGRVAVVMREERPAGLTTLTEWKHTRSLLGLRDRLARIYAGQYCAEITAHLTEDWDPHPGLYEVLVATLAALAEAHDVLAPVVRYQAALLRSIGSMPRFDACVGCGRTDACTHFSAQEGGLVCRHCEPGRIEKRALSASVRQSLGAMEAEASATPWRADPAALPGMFDIMDYYIAYMMGKHPRLTDKLVPPAVRRTLR